MRKEIRMTTINNLAKEFNMELVKGEGYFYWVTIDPDQIPNLNMLDTTSVYVYKLNDLPFTEWVVDMVEKYNQCR